ncbi:MAG: 4-hydroxybenzoate octaprenyltransferase [Azospirillaceae bacterium]
MSADASDIPADSWIDRRAPAPWRPYMRLMRLDRPIGTWLLLLPCWWGLAMAPRPAGFGAGDLAFAILFAIGAIIMRGAGCTLNDILDRDFDAMVARTRGRPIPSGAVSVRGAAMFLVALLLAGLAVLLQFNWPTILVGAASLLLVGPYPLMKRITWWPQAWLGLTFNWGALVGWTAVTGSLDWPAAILYAGGIVWTLGYDTIYAHQDKEDDQLIGVKSSALALGSVSKPWVAAFYAVALALVAAAGLAAGLHPAFLAGIAVATALSATLVWGWSPDDGRDCLARFKANRDIGLIVAAALLAGRALA